MALRKPLPLTSRSACLLDATKLPFCRQCTRHFSTVRRKSKPLPTSYRWPGVNHHGIRFTSTSQAPTFDTSSIVNRTKNLLFSTTIGLALVLGYFYCTDNRAGIHQWAVVPTLRWVYDDAEEAHEAGTTSLKLLYAFGLHPRERGDPDGSGDLSVEVFGHTLANPIGTSAGIDKHAEIPDPLLALGPSIIEIGGTTPHPQDGNPKPRVFRLPSQKALINRYGLNSEGADHVAMRLQQRLRKFAFDIGFGIDEEAEQRVLDGEAGVPPGSLSSGNLMAIQVAKNKFTPDSDIEAVKSDYVYCVEALSRYADIIVVNVSSPNTPGLRGLQQVEPLTIILKGVVEAAKRTQRRIKPAVMVKVSPDEDAEDQIIGIAKAIWESGVDGVIVGNTTRRRPDPLPAGYTLSNQEAAVMQEEGGYSSPQQFERTKSLTQRYRRILDEGLGGTSEEPSSLRSSTEYPTPTDELMKDPNSANHVSARIEASVSRDAANLKPESKEADASSKNQPLIRLPSRHNPLSSNDSPSTLDSPALSSSHHFDQLPHVNTEASPSIPLQGSLHRKVIFASGGISNGQQALEVLEAGASVAQIYTAIVYSGVGTITRIKGEMRQEMKRRKEQAAE